MKRGRQSHQAPWIWKGFGPKIVKFWQKVRFFIRAICMKRGWQSHQAPNNWKGYWPKIAQFWWFLPKSAIFHERNLEGTGGGGGESYFRPKLYSYRGGLVALPSPFHPNCFHEKFHFRETHQNVATFGQSPLQSHQAPWIWRGFWPKIAKFWWFCRKAQIFMKGI